MGPGSARRAPVWGRGAAHAELALASRPFSCHGVCTLRSMICCVSDGAAPTGLPGAGVVGSVWDGRPVSSDTVTLTSPLAIASRRSI